MVEVIPIQPFEPRTKIQVWGTETLVAQTEHYTAKVLVYEAGQAGGLQFHRRKLESFYLHEGEALVDYDAGDGTLIRIAMHPGDSYTIPCGAPHRFLALTRCTVFEASVPVEDDRVRVEDVYGVLVHGEAYGLETTPP